MSVLLLRSRFLLIHGQCPKAWAKRYGIEPFTYPCNDCPRDRTTTIPFACEEYRGLVCPPCPCGTKRPPPYAIVRDPKHGDLFAANWVRD